MYQLDNGTAGYTWKQEWILPYESTWGMIERFKNFNSLDSINCKKSLIKYNANSLYHEAKKLHIYYNRSKIDEGHITNFLAIPKGQYELLDKFETSYLREYADHKLKICPLCMAKGYHSYIHQFWWEQTCFLHQNTTLIRTQEDYALDTSQSVPYSKIKKYVSQNINSLDMLAETIFQNIIDCSKSDFFQNKNICFIDIINLNPINQNEPYAGTNQTIRNCLHKVLQGSKGNIGGVERIVINKYEPITSFDKSFFSDYCYTFSKEIYNSYDEKILKSTLIDFTSSVVAATIRQIYFDYDREAIAIIIAAAFLTGYKDRYSITAVFSEKWDSKRIYYSLYEEYFMTKVMSCKNEYQKSMYKELYQIIVKEYYLQILKEANQDKFSQKTSSEITINVRIPIYLIVEETDVIRLIEI